MRQENTSGDVNIVIGGEAGQGLVTVGDILSKTVVRAGYSMVVTQSYMSRIRGGHNTYCIRAGIDELQAPRESVDVLVAMNDETVGLHRGEMTNRGCVIIDGKSKVSSDGLARLAVPFSELSDKRYFNIAALGVVASLIGLDEELTAGAVDDAFGRKHPESVEANRAALAKAYDWMKSRRLPGLVLPPPRRSGGRIVMNGNQAIALGALSAGVKFCAFYPMTPATSIVLSLAAADQRMGVVVEQAEDEIAAINMAIGASFAGAPSMVATSGGGFALMTEGVSLAGITETPILIAVAMRPGPATGLPTRTAQGDLEFVLHSGHGEFPRAVFAPCNVAECFHLTRGAMKLAEKYQSPVFILTDQFMADSSRAVEPFALDGLDTVNPGAIPESFNGLYKRYALTQSGVSLRLLPGISRNLVVADSDEHTEEGHITEDLAVRVAMADKRSRKLGGITSEVIPPQYVGDETPELLFVTWGSSSGSVLEAAEVLRAGGRKVGTLCFSQVWPLVPEQFVERLEKALRVVGVEGNATGQFCRLIRRETGFEIRDRVLRYDGLPVTPEFVLAGLGKVD
ncbi:MAG TPA: 2-oxoacid:acceptor oxidoreductase subunit alpha [Candidatus Brocadiia bacterium]|nr:2-oxoacid:acceptor oxidoreductase subunit alpha [Candidatus Brocadiia bacterium]